MKANILDLIKIQQEVNMKVGEKTSDPISNEQYILAFNIELFEYFNAIGVWKWWKHSHKIDKTKVLDELADCFAFFLSLVDNQNKMILSEGGEDIVEKVQEEINHYLTVLQEYRFEQEAEDYDLITELIGYVGVDNESEPVFTTERFSIAIFLATVLFKDITWEEVVAAYKHKSEVNIQRQNNNY